MSKQFVILCSAHRLSYQDNTDSSGVSYYAFGLNLSAAVGTDDESPITAAEARSLRPWLWTNIDEVLGSSTEDGSSVFSCGIIKLPASIPDLDWDRLRSQLNEEYSEAAADFTPASWPLPDIAAGKQVQKRFALNLKPQTPVQMKPWHASIMQLSTYPYPIPQKLNLSFIVKVPASAMVGSETLPLYLAPVIKADTATPRIHFAVNTKPAGQITRVDNRGIFSWKYDQPAAAGLDVFAYIKPVSVRETTPAPRTYIDTSTGWVKRFAGSDVFEEDWRSYLESKLGEAFDVSELLLDYLRDHLASMTPEMMPFFQQMVVVSLRDLAGTGLIPSITGKTLPDDLLGPDPGDRLSAARLAEIRAVEKALFDTPITLPNEPANTVRDHRWRLFLAETIPDLARLGILDPIHWEQNRPPQECLADLEQLHKALMDQASLRAVVQNQWKLIFAEADKIVSALIGGWDNASKRKYETFKKRLSDLAPDFNYRGRLASYSLGPIWRALGRISAADINAPLDIRQLLPALLASHVQGRLKLTPELPAVLPADYDNHFPECDASQNLALVTLIVADVKDKALAIATEILPPNSSPDKATDVPHSISLQAHLTTMIPDGDKAFENVLSQISGVLVLMRNREHTVWRCLSNAMAKVRGDTIDRLNVLTVPTRINYQNGLSQSLVTYNNAPLSAKSPLAEIPARTQNTVVAPPGAMTRNSEHKEPLINYHYFKNPADINDPRSKIEALVFRNPALPAGQYEAAVCSVSASGALPRELTVRDNPWEINQAKLASLTFSSGAGVVRSFSYLRKVRVGQIRSKTEKLVPGQPFPDPNGSDVLNLPRVPAQVRPRALELPPVVVQGKERLLGNQLPLLLLAPRGSDDWSVPDGSGGRIRWQSSFDFNLRKPATDVETWHRWVNQGDTNKAWRANVLADYYDKNEFNRNLSANIVRTDIGFDDPAVEGFYVRVRRFDLDQDWRDVSGSPMEVAAPTGAVTNTMGDVQSNPIQVTCRGNTSGAAGVTALGGVVKINGVAGEIYWIQIHPRIKKTERPRFARFFDQEFEAVPGKNYLLASPFEALMEVATKDLPSPGEIWTSLTPQFKENADGNAGDRVEVRLLSNHPLFRHVYRAELQRQSWYWRGRETAQFPAAGTAPFDFVNPDLSEGGSGPGLSRDVRKWEEFEFAGRDESDFTVIDFKSGNLRPTGGKAELFTYTEQLTPESAGDSAAPKSSDGSKENGDLRANYYRFSARVFSRYEGIIATINDRSREALSPDLAGTDPLARWRRLYVPCRRREVPPVPQIKLIVPLTENFIESASAKKRSPGLLVVLNESWHQFGGLGEGIAAEVETLADPHNTSTVPDPCPVPGSGVNRFYYELGPDPIVDGRSNPLLKNADPLNPTVSLGGIRGPVGHTHDTEDEGALFSATSFVIPAPAIAGHGTATVDDLAWYMAKIRLRRVVRLRGTSNTDPAAELRSDFTPPQWVQYLPDFSLFSNARQTKDLVVRVNGSVLSLFARATGSLVRESDLSGPVENSNPIFKVLLLLTRYAYDASGRRNQEVFVGLCKSRPDGTWDLLPDETSPTALSALSSNADVRFRVRVLELQAVPEIVSGVLSFPRLPPTTKDLFDLLFAYKKDDGTAIDDLNRPRVVRLSQPIEDFRS